MKKEAIEHYDRMIAWAEKQPQDSEPWEVVMYRAIGEQWFGEDCVYCDAYDLNCARCPLAKGKEKMRICCGGLWFELNDTETWADWVKAAKKVRAYIRKTRVR